MFLGKLCRKYELRLYEYIYFFLMVIYMAYMVPETRVMTGGITTRPVAFAIPVFLTVILLLRNRVKFGKNFYFLLILLLVWSVIQIEVKKQYQLKELANYFYIIYAYILAYIHFSIYKKKMFVLYEDIMVIFAKISLVIWLFTTVAPNVALQVARLFPQTPHGYNFLFLINWIDPNSLQVTYGMIRNSGCAWEPGRFAIMLCLAILVNLYDRGVVFRKNKNVIWLLVALLTTMSTTGYVLCVILYLYFYVKRLNLQYVLGALIVIVPVIYFGLQLEFIGEKLQDRLNVKEDVDHIEMSWQWTEQHNENEDGVAYSMDRFPSMYFEFQNFMHDPIIGYGANVEYSYFYKNYTTALGFCGGLAQIFGKYGIILGLIFFFILYKSSIVISRDFESRKTLGFFIYAFISMISYPLIWQALYTAFWFYGYYENKNLKKIR